MFITSKFTNPREVATITSCAFTENTAGTFGGAIYAINQRILISKALFLANIAGDASNLFADAASAGGGVWYSSQTSESMIRDTVFKCE